MAKAYDRLDERLSAWIASQKVFFVASAPLSAEGHVNLSPKGGDAFRILDERTVFYADYAGSGAETAAHLRENGRITLMFCAFEGNPLILRLYGRGELLLPGTPAFAELAGRVPANPGLRSFIKVHVSRVSTSCGFGVPEMSFQARRRDLDAWAERKGSEGLREFREKHNRISIDGLPALDG
jgi:hypothetical protein